MLTKDEAMAIINRRITGTDDESLADIERLTDFVLSNDVETAVAEKENEWRKKYRDRFFSGGDRTEKPNEKKRFDDLFKEE